MICGKGHCRNECKGYYALEVNVTLRKVLESFWDTVGVFTKRFIDAISSRYSCECATILWPTIG